MKRVFVYFALVGFVFAIAGWVQAATDPRVGTWKLSVAKSKSSDGQLPMSETRTYTVEGSDIMGVTEGVDASGKPISSHYNATANGKDHSISPDEAAITVAIRQTGPGAYAGTIKKNGKVIATNTAVISGGGKIFTFKTRGTNEEGQLYTSELVFERQ